MAAKRILVAAGGTGGHLYPGLALAAALKNRGHEIHFAVRPGDLAIPILETYGFPFQTVRASGFPRTFSLMKALTSILNVGFGLADAFSMARSRKPNVVVGMGGHISFPVILAGRVLGTPAVLHEQNALPGLANRILAPFASAVGVSFPETRDRLGKKSVLTGNPVRDQFKQMPINSQARKTFGLDENLPTVLVFGGSLGAQAINESVVASLPFLTKTTTNIQFLHLTGPKDRSGIEAIYRFHGVPARVLERTEQMAAAYAAADLVIARSGATTIAELIATRKPAILIPYPLASENHQRENALILAHHGWADVIDQKKLDPQTLANLIRDRLQKPLHGAAMPFPNPLQAASLLADLVEKYAR